MNYYFLMCNKCKDHTVHHSRGIGCPIYCIRHEINGNEVDEVKAWDKERDAFRAWISGLNISELLEISNDVKLRLDYESDYLNRLKGLNTV